jgi:hypothetical protein
MGDPPVEIRIAKLGLVGFVGFGRGRDSVADERVLGFGGKFRVCTRIGVGKGLATGGGCGG